MSSAPSHPFPEYAEFSERASELRRHLDRSRESLVDDVRSDRISGDEIAVRREEHFALVDRVRQTERDAVDALLSRC